VKQKIKLLTYWKDKNLECCCPSHRGCNKNHGCEELDFILDPYADMQECMSERSYIRVNSRMQQRR